MSLLSTDITKVKRLSLTEVKLPIAQREEPTTPILVERPPTPEEIAYSSLIAERPIIEELVERLDLVSVATGQRIRKVKLPEDISSPPALKTPEIDKLITLAQRVIKGENSYSREEIIDQIIEATNVSQDRADKGFNLILQAGAIELTPGGTYYLTGSTPF